MVEVVHLGMLFNHTNKCPVGSSLQVSDTGGLISERSLRILLTTEQVVAIIIVHVYWPLFLNSSKCSLVTLHNKYHFPIIHGVKLELKGIKDTCWAIGSSILL